MRVVLFSTIGAMIAAVGLAAAQQPVLPPELPEAPPTPVAQAETPPVPVETQPAPSAPSDEQLPPAPTAKPPVSDPAMLPPPMPMQPVNPQPANGNHSNGKPPVAAWAAMDEVNRAPQSPMMNLAQYYNQPYRGPQMWGNVEWILWWIRPEQIKGPLVMTTIVPEDLANSPQAGSVVDPNAAISLGYMDVNFGTFSGMRGVSGFWFDRCQNIGYEGSLFYLEQRSQNFKGLGGTSLAAAQPAFTVPFNSVGPGPVVGETAAVVAGPFAGNRIIGTVGLRISSQLYGGDSDLLVNWWKGEFWRIDGIAGYKYLNLNEEMTFRTNVLSFLEGRTTDVFHNINSFNGGELGARMTYSMSNLGFEGTAKCAIGGTHQVIDNRGASIQPTNLGGKFVPGGIFVVDSNMGRETHNRFGTVTNLGCNLWYEWNQNFRSYLGCNYIYWTNVLRPGDQIDHNINPNLVPIFGGDATGVGLRVPRRINAETDFWAFGLSMGMSFTW